MSGPRPRVGTRALAAGVLALTLLLAGVVSLVAATAPDGLTRVAQDQGFAQSETPHDAAGSPLAGYAASDVADDRLSRGVAGVVGVLVVLVLAGGLARVVRRPWHADPARPGAGVDSADDVARR